jgi:hypothetical protein
MNRAFGALILSHGRPDRVYTYDTLRRHGYTGLIFILIDSEDDTKEQYIKKYGSKNVIIFDKDKIATTIDMADTRTDKISDIYARNAAWGIAKNLGLEYFIELDDDYLSFRHRYADGEKLGGNPIKSLDRVIEAFLNLLDDTGAKSVAMSQGGDHIGGTKNRNFQRKYMRKVMNSFIFRTDNPMKFIGRLNDDVNSFVVYGSRGDLFFTMMNIQLTQRLTQSNDGGMTDLYLDSGTYVKSFYTVMMHPSSVKVGTMGPTNRRYHHVIAWENTVPKILSSKYKKLITEGAKS